MSVAKYNDKEGIPCACRCCLTTGSFYNIWNEYVVDGKKVVFADMLWGCFGIKISSNIVLVNSNDQICESCIHKLYDADKFRRQIIAVQDQLGQPLIFRGLENTITKNNILYTNLHKPNNKLSDLKAVEEDAINKHTTYKKAMFSVNINFIPEKDETIQTDDQHLKDLLVIQSDFQYAKGNKLTQYIQHSEDSMPIQSDIQYIEDDDNDDEVVLIQSDIQHSEDCLMESEIQYTDEVVIESEISHSEGNTTNNSDIPHSEEDTTNNSEITTPVVDIETLKSLITGDFFLKALSDLNFNVEENSNVEIILPSVGKLNRKIMMKSTNLNKREDMIKRCVLEDLSYQSINNEKDKYQKMRDRYEFNIEKCIDAINSGKLTVAEACSHYKCTEEVITERRKQMRRVMIEGIKRLQKEDGEIIIKQVITPKVIPDHNIQSYTDELMLLAKQATTKRERERKIREIFSILKRGDITLQEASQILNLTLEELTEKIEFKYPKEYKNILYLDKIKESSKDNDFDESKMNINDDNEEDMRVVKVVRKDCTISKENLIKAVEAVKNGSTLVEMQKIYNITPRILKRFINTDMEITDENIALFKAHNKSNQSAKHSVNRKGVFKVEVVDNINGRNRIKIYNLEHRIKIEKHVHTILELTNATPFYVTHHNKYLCAYCGLSTDNPDLLREHTRTAHLDERLTKVPDMLRPAYSKEIIRLDLHDLKCTECNIELAKIDDLYQHLENQHKYLIEQSERNLIIPFDLIYFRYKCAICDERSVNINLLDVHMNNHFNNYICQECGQSCVSYIHLIKHNKKERCYTRTYECKICKQKIQGITEYNKHTARHTGVCCPYCSERFKHEYFRYKHVKEMHKDKLKNIKCKECCKVFAFKSLYINHYRKVHLKERDYKCCYCSKMYFLQSVLKRHMTLHVGESQFKCKICQTKFPSSLELNKHWNCHVN